MLSANDVNAFFGGVGSNPLKQTTWTGNDYRWGQAMVHHYQFQTLPRLQQQDSDNMFLIPKQIHFIWLGDKPLPLCNTEGDEWNQPMKSWAQHHPKWVFQVWRDEQIEREDWYNRDALKYAIRNRLYGMASDILRLEILFQQGGVYIDVDYMCVESIDKLHETSFDFYCGASNTGCVETNNGLMASSPGHALVRSMMESIHSWFEAFTNNSQPFDLMAGFLDPASRATLNQVTQLTAADIIRNTGPGLLTKSVAEALSDGSENLERIAVLPYQIFHPLSNSFKGQALSQEVVDSHVVPGQTKAVHLWQCSWQ